MAGAAEFEVTTRVLVPSLAGCGTQFNQHVFASITGAPPDAFADLEQKVRGLEPQLVRVFYNDKYAHDATAPDQMESFLRTNELAQQAGAVINVTWQSGPDAYSDPDPFMGRFADALDRLVTERGVSSLRWVTIQNEPNTPPQKNKTKVVTPEKLADLYHRLDQLLEAKGLRRQIRFMGGDLIRNDQRRWFEHMASSMAGIVDAYSTHIYWNYWAPAKFKQRLTEVQQIVEHLPGGPKPLFVTEYGIRGRNREANKHDPGDFDEGTPEPLGETTIAAFQHAWFVILAAQLGYAGTIKWDCFCGKYDKKGTLAYHVIGPHTDGWKLSPTYWVLRLFTMTTERGWEVRAVDRQGASTKQLAAFAGPAGELTVLGLDTRGALTDDATPETYAIGGLPPGAELSVVIWNRGGRGKLFVEPPVVPGAEGVAQVTVPRRAVFALTTKHFRP